MKLYHTQINKDLQLDLKIDDYNEAKEIFINVCIEEGVDLEKIGIFGAVSNPGISDLDFLVIGSINKLKRIKEKHNLLLESNEKYKYIFWHTPVFVPDIIFDKAHLFHTFDNLEFLKGGIEINRRSFNQNNLLHLIWFIFLIDVYHSIMKKKLNREPISMRLLLLVYKNINYSFNNFSIVSDNLNNQIAHSSDLRKYVIQNYDKFEAIHENFILSNLSNLFKETQSVFDRFCYNSFSNQLIKNNDKSKYMIKSSNTILRSGYNSDIKTCKRISFLKLNSIAYNFISDFYFGNSEVLLFDDYISKSKLCMELCIKNSIEYPFIIPIYLSQWNIKQKILLFTNKILYKAFSDKL